jgi:hypothetical protein
VSIFFIFKKFIFNQALLLFEHEYESKKLILF